MSPVPFKKIRKISAFILTGAVCTACITEDIPESKEYVGIGDTLPFFELTTDDGRQLNTDSLRGRRSMIVFFNTDCADCRKELPVIDRVAEQCSSDVATICISREEGAREVAEYWRANSLTLPYSAQTDRSIFNLFASSGIPRIYISDADLHVTFIFSDLDMPSEQQLLEALH